MTPRSPKNKGASVRQRLLNHAKAAHTDYNQLLVRYAIERLLYRLSVSAHRNAFVLKGAMLFAVWKGTPHRPTQDLDLLGFGERSDKRLIDVFRELCIHPVEDDGLTFDPSSVTAEAIRPEDDYGGIRVLFTADLGGARIRMQVDIGFGDAVTPAAVEGDYPNLLSDLPRANLRMYPRETVVAEKLEAITTLGMLNTRFKDYYDLHYLSQTFGFDGATLAAAISSTFARRGTPLPPEAPIGLTSIFATDPTKATQWKAFKKRIGDQASSGLLEDVVTTVAAFVMPPLNAAATQKPFTSTWPAPGGWMPRPK
jgi:predicted nucleotidyltransferase component of viral defense system